MVTAVSLFTGCGGSDLGFIQAGGKIVMANDILNYASDFYSLNLPETDYYLGDISKINSFPKADVLIGCYPCQGYSQGGIRNPKAKINYLYKEYYRALININPKAFIIENVSGLRRKGNKEVFDDQIRCFEDAGYSVSYKQLFGLDFGLAQKRRRIFIVGIRRNLSIDYSFPSPTHGNDLFPFTTIKDAIDDLPVWPEKEEYYALPFHWYYLSRDRYSPWDGQSKTIVANARHIPLHPASPKLQKITNDHWQFIDDRPARRFSYRECARLQGFPKNFIFPDGKLMDKYKVIGNAVPPVMFEKISENIINLLS